MDKKDYNELYDSYTTQIADLKKKLAIMKNAYIEEHRKYQNGDAVSIAIPNNEPVKCFVKEAYESGGEIHYNFIAMKKDGNPSSRNQYISHYFSTQLGDVITLLNTDYRNKNWDGSPIIETN